MEKITDEEFEAYNRKRIFIARVKAIAITVAYISVMAVLFELTTHSLEKVSQYFLSNIDSDTQGTIVKAKKTRRGFAAHYSIEYEYFVKGISYRGDIVNYKWKWSKQNTHKRILATYPVGSIVTVHYDAEKPDYAVLEDDFLDFGNFFPILFILVLSPIILWVHLPSSDVW